MALLGSLLYDSIAALVLVLFIAYYYGTYTYDYFKKRGIPYVKPLPIVGNMAGAIFGRYTVNSSVKPLYDELKKHRFGGIFQFLSPAVLVCDPELIKMVLIKDFASLHDHGAPSDEVADPLSVNLFSLPGAKWKNLRMKLSPVFTSGRLKHMFSLMRDCSTHLNTVLREKAEKDDIIEMKDFLVRYSTDVIGTTAFGIDCNSLENPESIFYKTSQSFFKKPWLVVLRFAVLANSKILAKIVPMHLLFPNLEEFFIKLMEDTIKYRKTNNVERNDFVQLLMQLQNNDEGKTAETHPDEVIFSDSVIAAQAFFFFIAGLDAIAGIVGLALHHLSIDTRLQDDLADEVISVINQHDGEITYQGLKEMKLLDMVISETLRMYPPGGSLLREVTSSSYTFPDSDFTFEKGFKVIIPVHGLHHDPDIYPEPEKFDPYRFTEEACSKRHPFAYLPFGEGPRVCIANRFVLLELRLCLACLIKENKFSVCSKTQIPMELQKRTISVAPTKGFYLKIEKRSV